MTVEKLNRIGIRARRRGHPPEQRTHRSVFDVHALACLAAVSGTEEMGRPNPIFLGETRPFQAFSRAKKNCFPLSPIAGYLISKVSRSSTFSWPPLAESPKFDRFLTGQIRHNRCSHNIFQKLASRKFDRSPGYRGQCAGPTGPNRKKRQYEDTSISRHQLPVSIIPFSVRHLLPVAPVFSFPILRRSCERSRVSCRGGLWRYASMRHYRPTIGALLG
jgi:hypothetical protein